MRLVYDDDALYVAVRCFDLDPPRIIERLTRRDRDTDADKISIDVDSRRDRVSAFHFEVNVSGVLTDALRFNDTDYNPDWDGLWNARTQRNSTGWSAEIEIPWRTLRYAGDEPIMGLQVRRSLARRQETDEWAYIPRSARAEVSRYGSLVGVVGLGPARLIEISPYAGLGVDFAYGNPTGPSAGTVTGDSTGSAVNGTRAVPNAGVDMKLGLSSSLTLDATFNPDFGQVEADQVVLNLTTFEVIYPEKRPFFLEGVELFATPIHQFYTRRIGHAPPAPYLSDGESVLDAPSLGRIWGAAKLSGQIVPHLSVAALDAVTAEEVALVERPHRGADPRPPPSPRLVDPLANYAVLRLRYDVGSSYIGVLGTAVDRLEPRLAATPNPTIDLCPDGDVSAPGNGRCTHDAYTAGLDGKWVTGDGVWGLQGQAVVGHVEGGPTRTAVDGTVLRAGDTGYGLYVQGGKQGGEPLRFSARYEGYTPTLDLSDAGYLLQPNQHYAAVNLNLRTSKPLGPTLESSIDAFAYARFSWVGTLLGRGAGVDAWARLPNFWQLYGELDVNLSHFDNRETRDGTLTERVGNWSGYLWLRTDPRSRLLVEGEGEAHRVQHGAGGSGDIRFTLRPLPQFELEVTPRFSYVAGDPRWARTDTDESGDRTYWFGDLDSRAFDVTLRGIYTFTPRLTLQAYAQVFVAAGHYANFVSATVAPAPCPAGSPNPCPFGTLHLDSFGGAPSLSTSEDFRYGSINVNVVLRWEFQPGSTVLAVYSRSQSQPSYDPAEGPGLPTFTPFASGPATDILLVKLSYLWR